MQGTYQQLSRCQSMSGTCTECAGSDRRAPRGPGRLPDSRGADAVRSAGATGAAPSLTGRDGNVVGAGAAALVRRECGRDFPIPASRAAERRHRASCRARRSRCPQPPGRPDQTPGRADPSPEQEEERVSPADRWPVGAPSATEPGGPAPGAAALVVGLLGTPAGSRAARAVLARRGPHAATPRPRMHEGSASRRSPRPAPQGVRRTTSSWAARAAAARCRSW